MSALELLLMTALLILLTGDIVCMVCSHRRSEQDEPSRPAKCEKLRWLTANASLARLELLIIAAMVYHSAAMKEYRARRPIAPSTPHALINFLLDCYPVETRNRLTGCLARGWTPFESYASCGRGDLKVFEREGQEELDRLERILEEYSA